jgi:hypothetical protein
MPLQIGAPDVAFPRLNMFAYWLYLFGGLVAALGFLTPAVPRVRLVRLRTPLSNSMYSPGSAATCGVFGLTLGGFGTILGSVNFITTIVCMRAPGMTMFRMPIFTWTILVTSILALIIFPVLAAALFGLGGRPALRDARLRRPTAARCCGSTCSGSSATPRSTSSRCRSSASSARSSRSSRASRSSATRRSSSRRSHRRPVVAVWAHHMYVTGPGPTCRSSRS